MNKRIFLLSIFSLFLLVFSGVVNAALISPDVAIGSGYPGDTKTTTFSLQNTGITAVTGITITSGALTNGINTIAGSAISFNPNTIVSLAAAATQNIGVSLLIPVGQASGTYTGTITITDGGINTDTSTLTLTVLNPLNVQETNVLIVGQEDESKTGTVVVKNLGSQTLSFVSTSFTYTQSDFSDGSKDITLSFSPATFSLIGVSQQAVTINANIPKDINYGEYKGIINVVIGNYRDSFELELRVQPEICENGPIGNDLTVEIKEPDNNDKFKVGETIDLEIKVKNEGNDDKDVIVEAFLYDITDGEEIADSVESDSVPIDKGDSETFNDLKIEIPVDEDINEDNDFILYVKAYEEDAEDESCEESHITIDIKRDKDDVVINKITLVPEEAQCGSSVDVNIDVYNKGTQDQQDVYVELKNTLLNLKLKSELFDVDSYDNDEDAEKRVPFTFTVPENAKETDYSLEAVVYDEDGDVYKNGEAFANLKVTNCKPIVPPGMETAIRITQTNIEGEKGKTRTIPVEITNNKDDVVVYSVELTNIDDWAGSSIQTVNVGGKQSSIVYMTLSVNDDAAAGKHSATVNVKSGIATTTQSFVVDVKETSKGLISFGGIPTAFGGSTLFWVIGDILLLVVAIFFIKLIFTSGRKRERGKVEEIKRNF